MISEKEKKEIKKNLNRSTSAIFILGQGLDPQKGLFHSNYLVKKLYGSNQGEVKRAWENLLSAHENPCHVPFIEGFTNYVELTAPVKLSRFVVLNTSISVHLEQASKNCEVINLNGLLHKGICSKTGVIKKVTSIKDMASLLPTFIPEKENYSSLYDSVCRLEKFVEQLGVRSVFFIGTSGSCPITESIFNRCLVRTLNKDPIYKVVVNKDKTYMDEEADLVIRCDAFRFLTLMEDIYPDAKEYFIYG